MVLYGPLWFCMVQYGPIWSGMAMYCPVWSPMDVYYHEDGPWSYSDHFWDVNYPQGGYHPVVGDFPHYFSYHTQDKMGIILEIVIMILLQGVLLSWC